MFCKMQQFDAFLSVRIWGDLLPICGFQDSTQRDGVTARRLDGVTTTFHIEIDFNLTLLLRTQPEDFVTLFDCNNMGMLHENQCSPHYFTKGKHCDFLSFRVLGFRVIFRHSVFQDLGRFSVIPCFRIWSDFPPFHVLGFGVIFCHSTIPPFQLLGSPK